MFGGFWIADNSRMRLMYEAPLIVLWFFVPYRMLGLRWSPGQRNRRAANPDLLT